MWIPTEYDIDHPESEKAWGLIVYSVFSLSQKGNYYLKDYQRPVAVAEQKTKASTHLNKNDITKH